MQKEIALVIDLGTTTLSGSLLNLIDGKLLAEGHISNPQQEFGVDILLRLQLAGTGRAQDLQNLLVKGLRKLVAELLLLAGCRPDEITSAVAAGNPGMSTLLLNLSVDDLLSPPHKPPNTKMMWLPVDDPDLGLTTQLGLFPCVSGFVGGDLVAVLVAVESLKRITGPLIPRTQATTKQQLGNSKILKGLLVIDVGTNAELALWDGTHWWVTSAAAGPAFEGGNIGTGMILTDGAITDVRLTDDSLQLSIAGKGSPRGLCGSGLAALVAAARQGGLIDVSGRIRSAAEVETNLGRYLVQQDDGWAIRFHRDASGALLLTQEDLRNFQLAKGAVRAATEVLLERAGFTPESVSRVLVTGALGTALPVEVLKRVALLPEAMIDKTSFVANGVLAGLQTYLTDTDPQQRLAALMTRLQPLPLSGTPAFEKHFLAALEL